MKLANTIVFPLVFILATINTSAQLLQGSIGSSREWKSGWLDLRTVSDFSRGDTLNIFVGGTASQVVVRFLPRDAEASSAEGIDGDIRNVSQNRILRVVLDSDHKQVRQISVHGGESPFGLFNMSPGNGPATIVRINLFRKRV